jgi:hypothetical protein
MASYVVYETTARRQGERHRTMDVGAVLYKIYVDGEWISQYGGFFSLQQAFRWVDSHIDEGDTFQEVDLNKEWPVIDYHEFKKTFWATIV